ncbi:MAG: ABC transporter ATP-binding protein [Candidatus Korarchaeum sp.]
MIELTNLWKRYNSIEVLKGVNLEVDEGEFISIRGKSGTGKSTLLKIMGLLESPSEGEVRILGRNVNRMSDDEKCDIRLRNIGFIFQFFNLIPSLNVIENVELPLAIAGIKKQERRRRVIELLSYFGLLELANRFPETLSGGEKQRIAVIRALVNNPKIILADEPTSSLDIENSRLLIDLLSKINTERDVTIVLTTTDLYERLPTDRDFLLKNGYLIKL